MKTRKQPRIKKQQPRAEVLLPEEIKRRRDAAAIADSDETMPTPKDKPNGGKPSGDNNPDDDDDGDDGDGGVLV